jgi:L-galactose dehydrogenase
MTYRQLGKTQLTLSIVGFGASPLGDVFGAVEPQEAVRAVTLAIDEGINFFDVSPYYGRTLAEERLGGALEGRREKIILATKCGRYGTNTFDFSSRGIRNGIEASLKRLRTDYVDLLQAHDIEFGNASQIIEETIPAMRRLQEEGKARYIGITGYPLRTLIAIAEAVPVDSILSYCHYNLLTDDLDSVSMPFAEKRSIGVINASPLHMGMLTERGAPDWHPAPAEVRDSAKQAAEYCRLRGADLSELALQLSFSYPRVASTLVGISGTEDVRRSLRAALSSPDMDLMHQVKDHFAPVFNRIWPSGRT